MGALEISLSLPAQRASDLRQIVSKSQVGAWSPSSVMSSSAESQWFATTVWDTAPKLTKALIAKSGRSAEIAVSRGEAIAQVRVDSILPSLHPMG